MDRHVRWLLVAPAVLLILALSIFPLGFSLWVNFVEFDTNCRQIMNCGSRLDAGGVCTAHHLVQPTGAVPPAPPIVTMQGDPGGADAWHHWGQWIYFDVKSITPM